MTVIWYSLLSYSKDNMPVCCLWKTLYEKNVMTYFLLFLLHIPSYSTFTRNILMFYVNKRKVKIGQCLKRHCSINQSQNMIHVVMWQDVFMFLWLLAAFVSLGAPMCHCVQWIRCQIRYLIVNSVSASAVFKYCSNDVQ